MRIFTCLLVFSAVMAGPAIEANADIIPITKTVSAQSQNGLQQCKEIAVQNAKKQSIADVIESLTGDANARDAFLRDGDADCCSVKVRAPRTPVDLGARRCEVTIQVKIDSDRVRDMLKESGKSVLKERDTVAIGAVVRFFVDGERAKAEDGYVPLAAAAEFESQLNSYGIKMVNLSAIHDSFALQNFGSICSVTGEEPEPCREYTTYAKSVRKVIENVRFGVKFFEEYPDFRLFKENGGWLLIGQVFVTSDGRDPEGIRFRSEVRTRVSLYNVDNGETISAYEDHTLLSGGDRQTIANTIALKDSVRKTSEQLVKLLNDRSSEKTSTN